jgi:hypothetical protein
MGGAIPPHPQYASIAWCSVKPQGQLYLLLMVVNEACYRVKHGDNVNIYTPENVLRRRNTPQKDFSQFSRKLLYLSKVNNLCSENASLNQGKTKLFLKLSHCQNS